MPFDENNRDLIRVVENQGTTARRGGRAAGTPTLRSASQKRRPPRRRDPRENQGVQAVNVRPVQQQQPQVPQPNVNPAQQPQVVAQQQQAPVLQPSQASPVQQPQVQTQNTAPVQVPFGVENPAQLLRDIVEGNALVPGNTNDSVANARSPRSAAAELATVFLDPEATGFNLSDLNTRQRQLQQVLLRDAGFDLGEVGFGRTAEERAALFTGLTPEDVRRNRLSAVEGLTVEDILGGNNATPQPTTNRQQNPSPRRTSNNQPRPTNPQQNVQAQQASTNIVQQLLDRVGGPAGAISQPQSRGGVLSGVADTARGLLQNFNPGNQGVVPQQQSQQPAVLQGVGGAQPLPQTLESQFGQRIVPGTETDLRQQLLSFNPDAPQVDAPQNIQPQQVQAGNLTDSVRQAFESQLPLLNQDLQRQTGELAENTAALGRTGSGLFNSATDNLSDQARAQRESLLGNLAFQASQTDVQNDLQAQQLNQQAGLTADRFNRSLGFESDRFNELQRFNRDFEQRRFLSNQQQRQDRLADQAMADAAQRAQLLSQAFGGPTATELAGAQAFGGEAGLLGNQIGSTTALLAQLFGGGQQDNTLSQLENFLPSLDGNPATPDFNPNLAGVDTEGRVALPAGPRDFEGLDEPISSI